jgi:type III pantothenate kinase
MLADLEPQNPGLAIQIIATGGLAPLIASGSRYLAVVDPYLTLTGIRIVYERTLERQIRHRR